MRQAYMQNTNARIDFGREFAILPFNRRTPQRARSREVPATTKRGKMAA